MSVGTAAQAATSGTWASASVGGSWAESGNWTGGIIANGTGARASFAPTTDINVAMNGHYTVGELVVTGSRILLLSDDGLSTSPTGNQSITFATGTGTPSIDLSGNTRNDIVMWLGRSGGANRMLSIRGTQGLIVDVGSGGNRRFRLSTVDWTGFAGDFTIVRGLLDPQVQFMLPRDSKLILGTASTPEADRAQLIIDGNAARSQRIGALDGIASSRIASNAASAVSNLDLGYGGGNGNFAGILGVRDAGTVNAHFNVNKFGTGTQIFSGNNIYTGYTRVREGTLLINGLHTSAGNYQVDLGATLGGTGTITTATASTFVVNGTMAPGASIGTLSVTTSLVGFGSGSTLAIEIDTNAVGQKIDLLAITGNLNLINPETLRLTGTLTSNGSYTLVTATGTINGVFETILWNGTPVTGVGDIGPGYSLVYGAQSIQLIPEPASFGLLGLASLGLLTRRSRRA